MRSLRALSLISLGVACLSASSAGAQAAGTDPMAGTWRLNLVKSTFTGAAPLSNVYRYENLPDGSTLWVMSSITPTGQPNFNFSIRRYDGQDYPTYNVTSLTALIKQGDNEPNTTQSSRLVDRYTTELLNKSDGVITGKVVRAMAPDGKSFTMRTYNPAGELMSTQHWDKVDQPPT